MVFTRFFILSWAKVVARSMGPHFFFFFLSHGAREGDHAADQGSVARARCRVKINKVGDKVRCAAVGRDTPQSTRVQALIFFCGIKPRAWCLLGDLLLDVVVYRGRNSRRFQTYPESDCEAPFLYRPKSAPERGVAKAPTPPISFE